MGYPESGKLNSISFCPPAVRYPLLRPTKTSSAFRCLRTRNLRCFAKLNMKMFAVPAFRRFAIINIRHLSNNTAAGPSTKQSPSPPKPSDSTPRKPEIKVGPGASKDGDYKNPEYYTYDAFSFANLELEMMKYRMPQPSPKN